MARTRTLNRIAVLILAALPALAVAHPGHGLGVSFATGALHPLTGIDHLMALAAVGLLAARMGGWARLAIPAAFMTLLGAGIAIGFAGVELVSIEAAILTSVIVCTVLAVVPPRRLPVATSALVGLFALFHGNAHGFEAADGSAHVQYAAGLMFTSALVIGITGFIASHLAAAVPAAPRR